MPIGAQVGSGTKKECNNGRGMKDIDSPSDLVDRLTELFPAFAHELDDEEVGTYHRAIRLLAPVLARFLKASSERTLRDFCDLVNYLVWAGDEKGNAISTCLLEHASQVGVRKMVRPYLGVEAKLELR